MRTLYIDKLTIIIGFFISTSLFILTFNYELEKDRLYFISSATKTFHKVETTFSTLNRINKEFSSRFYLPEDLNKDDFNFFSQSHITQNPFIEEILFADKVDRKGKHRYERTLKNKGYSGFKIKPFTGTTFEDSIFPEYLFPIKFIEPYSVRNSRWFGLDILTEPSLRKTIQSTRKNPNLLNYTPATGETNKLYAIRSLYTGSSNHTANRGLQDIFGILIYKININNIFIDTEFDSVEINIDNQILLKEHATKLEGLFNTTFTSSTTILLDKQNLNISTWRTINLLSIDVTFPVIIFLLGLTSTLFVWYVILSHVKINKLLSKQKGIIEDEVREKTGEIQEKANELSIAYTRQLELTDELEAFCYSVSHDLKAPLRSINGFSQILHDDYSEILDDEAKTYLSRTSAASKKMGNIIDDLLNLSKITRSNLNVQNINISDIVKKSIRSLREFQPERQITVAIQEDITARADPRLLQIALDNLVGNAWKYSEKNINARIEFGVTSGNGGDIYYIRDNGAGFNMKYASKLFIAFQRLHHKSEYEGTGIGLATVQRIIQKHNGRIWANSGKGKGATFYFTLSPAVQKPI